MGMRLEWYDDGYETRVIRWWVWDYRLSLISIIISDSNLIPIIYASSLIPIIISCSWYDDGYELMLWYYDGYESRGMIWWISLETW